MTIPCKFFPKNTSIHTKCTDQYHYKLCVLATAGQEDLYLEAVPDFDQTDISARICQLRILEVGHGLPCLHHRIRDNLTKFNRSHPDRPFFDFASLHLGQTCPTRSNEAPEDNDFLVQIVYELPPQESVTTGSENCFPSRPNTNDQHFFYLEQLITRSALVLRSMNLQFGFQQGKWL